MPSATDVLAGKLPVLSGRPFPLGASFDGEGTNFAVFSAHATRIDICFFAPLTGHETHRITLPECTDEVFHGYVPGIKPGTAYGLRAHGPYDPEAGHRFNPFKLLIDPYAKALTGRIRHADVMTGFQAFTQDDTTFDNHDSASVVPKALVAALSYAPFQNPRPNRALQDSLIYEGHVRGLTMAHSGVPDHERGTYDGLASEAMLDHLTKLGVTAIELLPVQAFVDEGFLVRKGLTNYWGYSPISYFAPEPRFDRAARGIGIVDRFRAMVDRLHGAGIEVILDVVYNHTGEVDQFGPTLSFRGLDNASYYRLNPNRPRWYLNDTGTGNTMNAGHPRVTQLIMDSLRYWVEVMGVDGFRFDLATTIGREAYGFDPSGRFLTAVRQDPILSRVKLIAEPWDIGPGGYQLGNFPPGFFEWNDRFRDTVRRFWRGDDGMAPDLAARLLGSPDLFDKRARRPHTSVNFVTAHDGFTLADLVAYSAKHNEANLEGNRDGHSDNHSANYGAEGPTTDVAIKATRARQVRNLIATMFLSQGTPMLTAGDELSNSQSGNNNAYCQDNPTGWVHWSGEDAVGLTEFVARLARFRRDHGVLRQTRFLHASRRVSDGMLDVEWVMPSGRDARPEDWSQHGLKSFGMVLRGSAEPHLEHDGKPVLVIFNAAEQAVSFTLPAGKAGSHWLPAFSTAAANGLPADSQQRSPGETILIDGRVVLAFTESNLVTAVAQKKNAPRETRS